MHSRRQNDGTPEPELPELESGVRLLDAGDDRATGPLHALVLDHLLAGDGDAVWVDADGHAVAQSLASLAPSTRVLDRIRVARGFTANQHYALVRRLREQVDDDTSLVVCPAFDRLYRDAEAYADEGEDLLLRALATVTGIADRHGVPVLVTRAKRDSFSEPVAAAARETLGCERTQFGPRFVGDDFETLVYPTADGLVQTTLAFWKRVLRTRVSISGTATVSETATTSETATASATTSETATPAREVSARGAY